MIVFLAWVQKVLAVRPRLIVHENVPEFPVELLHHHLGQTYGVRSLVFSSTDHGFELVNRRRRYSILWRLQDVQLCLEPDCVLSAILRSFRWNVRTEPLQCAKATPTELAEEVAPRCSSLQIPVQSVVDLQTGASLGFRRLLCVSELAALSAYEARWWELTGKNPACATTAVFNLVDHPDRRVAWSLTFGSIPGLRTNSGHLWMPFLDRWLTRRELLAAFGYPVYQDLADASGTFLWGCSPTPKQMGDAMHVASVGIAQLVALVCTRGTTSS